jgi:hypothetical protein
MTNRGTAHGTAGLSRRELISVAAAVTAGALTGGCHSATEQGSISEDDLIAASAVGGERLSRERIHAHKQVTVAILGSIQATREFDPDDEEPVAVFQL